MSVRDSRGFRLFVQCGLDLVEAGTLVCQRKDRASFGAILLTALLTFISLDLTVEVYL